MTHPKPAAGAILMWILGSLTTAGLALSAAADGNNLLALFLAALATIGAVATVLTVWPTR
jgi:hypothetical protein